MAKMGITLLDDSYLTQGDKKAINYMLENNLAEGGTKNKNIPIQEVLESSINEIFITVQDKSNGIQYHKAMITGIQGANSLNLPLIPRKKVEELIKAKDDRMKGMFNAFAQSVNELGTEHTEEATTTRITTTPLNQTPNTAPRQRIKESIITIERKLQHNIEVKPDIKVNDTMPDKDKITVQNTQSIDKISLQ